MSRPQTAERIAYSLGVTVSTVKRIIAERDIQPALIRERRLYDGEGFNRIASELADRHVIEYPIITATA